MSSFLKRIVAFGLQAIVISSFSCHKVLAEEKQNINKYAIQNFPSVDELSDITTLQRTQNIDESYLQNLQYFIQRYNIDTEYPLNKIQLNNATERDNFASILNIIIKNINQLQSQQKSNLLTQEELIFLHKLQTEFASELNSINNRIDKLENNSLSQFSTTTTMSGEIVFALNGIASGNKANDKSEKIDSNITFGNRAKIKFKTSFTGKDRLDTSLKTSDIKPLKSASGTDMARLAYQGDKDNDVELSDLTYRFPIGKKTRIYVGNKGLDIQDFADSINPHLDDTESGAISRFAQRNPIFRQGGGAGIGFRYEITDSLKLGAGYVANDANEPETGIIKSDYAAIAQLTLEPSKKLSVGLNYVHSYNNIDTNTGSSGANDPFDDNSKAITGDSFGLQASVALNQNFSLGSWVGYTRAKANDLPQKPTASIINWAVTFAFPDLDNKGSLAAIVIGQPPKLINNQYQPNNQEYIDKDTSLHLEAFYRFNINNNIAITPGIVVITNPEHNSDNDTIYIGTLRTTFSF
ncbi:Carbohydrate-selective porin, OprB family [Rivularia sp. PCC 7116]|uniref:iron uptake porin n=1 Tax=Rivularia sp. PCC 7116 TaxID=373994 RepID=UPI00029F2FB9|nr:iron uptake porin [Rivularia sp. PCC 7116]AFY55432.1 Carbohydrate-selective porin, OprB family [Rivularia sp. PCC 7116]